MLPRTGPVVITRSRATNTHNQILLVTGACSGSLVSGDACASFFMSLLLLALFHPWHWNAAHTARWRSLTATQAQTYRVRDSGECKWASFDIIPASKDQCFSGTFRVRIERHMREMAPVNKPKIAPSCNGDCFAWLKIPKS